MTPRRAPSRAVLAAAPVVVAAMVLTGCGTGGGAGGGRPSSRTVTVLAAASLTEAFEEIGRAFEAAHPGVDVVLSFGPSSGLAAQVRQGAPADVFAAASPGTMQQVVDSGDTAGPVTFARNALQIAVPADDPAGIRGLADLARPGVKVALCRAEVPCGEAARAVLTGAGVDLTPVSEEADVRAVLTKVRLGEVDAGLVYVTDVRAAGGAVRGVPVPDTQNVTTDYRIAVLREARDARLAAEFVAAVLAADGQAVLAGAGFAGP